MTRKRERNLQGSNCHSPWVSLSPCLSLGESTPSLPEENHLPPHPFCLVPLTPASPSSPSATPTHALSHNSLLPQYTSPPPPQVFRASTSEQDILFLQCAGLGLSHFPDSRLAKAGKGCAAGGARAPTPRSTPGSQRSPSSQAPGRPLPWPPLGPGHLRQCPCSCSNQPGLPR